MEFLTKGLQGLVSLAQTPMGAGVIICAILVMLIALIKWSPTKVDDKWLVQFGPAVFAGAAIVEKAIPDGTQMPVLDWIDNVAKSISDAGKIDISDEKLMTTVKKQLIKIAKASVKVSTSKGEMVKLKN